MMRLDGTRTRTSVAFHKRRNCGLLFNRGIRSKTCLCRTYVYSADCGHRSGWIIMSATNERSEYFPRCDLLAIHTLWTSRLLLCHRPYKRYAKKLNVYGFVIVLVCIHRDFTDGIFSYSLSTDGKRKGGARPLYETLSYSQ